MTSNWFFLSTLNYDARSTTHQINKTFNLRVTLTLAALGNRCCGRKSISITYSECVFVDFVIHIQRACAILSSVACPAVKYFSTLSQKRHDFRKKKLLNTICVSLFSLQLLPETFFIVRLIGRDMVNDVYWSLCKEAVVLARF